MSTAAYIVGSTDQRLWGITSRERIERQLRAAGTDEIIGDLSLSFNIIPPGLWGCVSSPGGASFPWDAAIRANIGCSAPASAPGTSFGDRGS